VKFFIYLFTSVYWVGEGIQWWSECRWWSPCKGVHQSDSVAECIQSGVGLAESEKLELIAEHRSVQSVECMQSANRWSVPLVECTQSGVGLAGSDSMAGCIQSGVGLAGCRKPGCRWILGYSWWSWEMQKDIC